MKLYIASSLFFILTVATADKQSNTTAKSIGICPSDDELKKVGCLCFPDTNYLICDGSSNFLDFKQRYSFDTLVIRNSPQLPFWGEHMKSNDFTVKSLVVLQSNENVKVADNFDELLKLPTEAIKIVSRGEINPLHLSNMPQSLASISVTGVPKLFHNNFNDFNLGERSKLKHLQFRNVTFEPPFENLVLNGMPLNVVEIIDSNVNGYVSVVPIECPQDGRIVVDLRGNRGLKGFGFSNFFNATLFNSSACHYHIDLSDNPKLDTDILVKNIPTLEKHGANMFIRIAGVDLVCDCPLINLYNQKLRNNIHSVQCKGENGKYLDEIANDSERIKNCIPTTQPPPTTTTKKPNSS